MSYFFPLRKTNKIQLGQLGSTDMILGDIIKWFVITNDCY